MLGEQTGSFLVKDILHSPDWLAPSQGQNIRNSRLYFDSSRNPFEDDQHTALYPISRSTTVVSCQMRKKGWTGMLNPELMVKLLWCLINPDFHSLICIRKGPVFHSAIPFLETSRIWKQESRAVCIAPYWCKGPEARTSSKSLRRGCDRGKTYRSWLHRKWRYGKKNPAYKHNGIFQVSHHLGALTLAIVIAHYSYVEKPSP